MNIIRKRLAASEIAPVDQRYNSDCDCIQYTPDGGTTWIDAPQFDPRSSTAMARPPYPSDDPACDAAASIVANMKAGLDMAFAEISLVSTGASAVTAILTLLNFITGIGLLISLIADLVLDIVSIGVEAVDEAFTDDVYSQLLCIFLAHVESDGTFTADDFSAIQSEISSTFGDVSTVNIVAQGWLRFLGNVGLTNVASAKHVTGVCTSCDCDPVFIEAVSYGTLTDLGDGWWGVDATYLSGFGYGCNIQATEDGYIIDNYRNVTGYPIENCAIKIGCGGTIYEGAFPGTLLGQTTDFVGMSTEDGEGVSTFHVELHLCHRNC